MTDDAGVPPLGEAPTADEPRSDTHLGPAHLSRRRRLTGWRRIAAEWGTVALIAVVLAVVARTFVFQAYFIPSGSMIPTLEIGDRILVDKLFFSASSLRTGDIIVFTRPPAATCGVGENDLVKRVIGLPGETLSSVGNVVKIDGKPLAEPYLPKNQPLGPPVSLPNGDRVIPKGDLFVMGDNRPDSCDSRYWGYVPESSVVGKVVLIWWKNGHPDFHVL